MRLLARAYAPSGRLRKHSPCSLSRFSVIGAEMLRKVRTSCGFLISWVRIMDQRCMNGPQTQRPLHPAAHVLGWLFECERTRISRSFVLLKQVRWWQGPAPQGL